jgi:flavin-dependent dehydrogenase
MMDSSAAPPSASTPQDWDVVVLGGALSGSSVAWLLRERSPNLRILVLEKSRQFKRRVGESTVEVSSYFLTRVLGLNEHLQTHHLLKQGLRFWFSNDEATGFDDCSEIGPGYNVRLPSFQVDRAVLDQHLLDRCAAHGIEVWRPATAKNVDLAEGGQQTIDVEKDGQLHTLRARWVVDATGLAAFLARRNDWLQHNTAHPTGSAWCRWEGVPHWDDFALRRTHPEFNRRSFGLRHTATNHLVGKGWWSWWIPLRNGETSVGIVWDERLCTLGLKGDSIPERIREHIGQHALGKQLLEHASPVERDSNFRRPLAYLSKRTIGDGFALVGDAAAFLDPFYSPGMDWISFSVMNAVDAVSRERQGENVASLVATYAARHQQSYRSWFAALYQDKYYYMGDFELMKLSFLLDLGLYYFGVVSQPYKYGLKAFELPPLSGPKSRLPAWVITAYNRRLAKIARSRLRRGTWGRHNAGHHFAFDSYTFDARLIARLMVNFGRWGMLEGREGWRAWNEPSPVATASASFSPQ